MMKSYYLQAYYGIFKGTIVLYIHSAYQGKTKQNCSMVSKMSFKSKFGEKKEENH